MSNVKRLALAIVQFLAEQKQYGNMSPDAQESLEVAVQCLETAFELSPDDVASLSVSKSLLDMFQETFGGETDLAAEATPEAKAAAEKLKNDGNNLMKLEQFSEALVCYSKAIEMDGRNAVYYCNRAAAHSKMNQHQAAVDDCKKAIAIDGTYSKAYGRMGLAYASLNQHSEAVTCYQRAVQLEPDNESYQSNLQIAEDKMKSTSAASAMSGMPGLGGLDVSAMLNNPGLMNMAQQMLSNPSMQQLMNQMMGASQGSSGGGPGGLDALLQVGQQLAQQMQASNPELVEQLRRQMGGGGGAGGAPGSDPAPPQQ